MSRTKYVRLDGDRLEKAIAAKGITKRAFGLECFEIMRRLGLRKGTGYDEEKQASNWVSLLLCKQDDDDPNNRKTGINPKLLNIISTYLGVRSQWLLGEDDYMTELDAITALETRQHERLKYATKKCKTLITPLLEKAGYSYRCPCLDMDGNPAGDFVDRDHRDHVILAEDLERIETVCIDLCVSMFRVLSDTV